MVGLGAVANGRSSSHKLNGVLRSFIPYAVGGQKSVVDIWAATDENVAGDPTKHKQVRAPATEAANWLRSHYAEVPVGNYFIDHARATQEDGSEAAEQFHQSVRHGYSKTAMHANKEGYSKSRNGSNNNTPAEGHQCDSKLKQKLHPLSHQLQWEPCIKLAHVGLFG